MGGFQGGFVVHQEPRLEVAEGEVQREDDLAADAPDHGIHFDPGVRDPENPKRWVIDEEGAETVRLIYALRLQGTSVNDIAKILRHRRVLTPSAYAARKGFCKRRCSTRGEYFWDHPIVRDILSKNSSQLRKRFCAFPLDGDMSNKTPVYLDFLLALAVHKI
ncbi:MAG: recombinase family protein, partial [Oscillospiraceae bacterium]|nr:recombinase family protein [Oscillospiraceae bacterium]